MNQELPGFRQLPRRCGNCSHAVRTAALDGTVVACVKRLEYHCADRIPDCGHYQSAINLSELDGGND